MDRNICFLAAVILFLIFAGTSLNPELVNAQSSYEDLINQGSKNCIMASIIFVECMPSEVILVYDEMLRKDPTNVPVLSEKADMLKLLLKFDEAKNILDDALRYEPDNLDVQIQRLHVLDHLKDHNEIRSSLVDMLGPNLNKIPYFDNPNCFSCFGHVPFLYQIRDTDDYVGSVHITVRDSNDNLVGVIESDLIYYPNHPIFDSSLSNWEVTKTIEKDGNVYEMKEIVTESSIKSTGQFMNMITLSMNVSGQDSTIKTPLAFLVSTNMGMPVGQGDYAVTVWQIGKKI